MTEMRKVTLYDNKLVIIFWILLPLNVINLIFKIRITMSNL